MDISQLKWKLSRLNRLRLNLRTVTNPVLLFFVFIGYSSFSEAATLQGIVVDHTGAPIPHVRIDFTGPVQRTTVTDSRGQYRIAASAGSYKVLISRKQQRSETQVTVASNKSIQLRNFKLKW